MKIQSVVHVGMFKELANMFKELKLGSNMF